ncbi:hypothetical protein I7I53_06298 [Histoplasma capsulatum var. duboisii H88]|uniref:Uncharacterized protein n=1 Tax=Ajellomyces capsulatus (strain H88) TaxID=544711 RepID=A0A8A1LEJ4_AJEC8|nr:hypothetical protein I7I53_06298 [Histoplasma capsulatum var. duboisii H88]
MTHTHTHTHNVPSQPFFSFSFLFFSFFSSSSMIPLTITTILHYTRNFLGASYDKLMRTIGIARNLVHRHGLINQTKPSDPFLSPIYQTKQICE